MMVSQCKYCSRQFASREARKQHEDSPAHLKRCYQCGDSFRSQDEYDLHKIEHRFVERSNSSAIRCNLCNVLSPSDIAYDNHARGRRHQLALKSASIAQYDPERIDVPINCQPCCICSTFVSTRVWAQHAAGTKHRKKLEEVNLRNGLDASEGAKHGVSIDSDEIDFGVVPAGRDGTFAVQTVRITNNDFSNVFVSGMRLSSQSQHSPFIVDDSARLRAINRTASLLVRVRLQASGSLRDLRGQLRNRLEMTFETSSHPKIRFTLTRPIKARIGPKEEYDCLPEPSPLARRAKRRKTKLVFVKFHHGVRPLLLAPINWVRRLPGYDIPPPLAAIMENEDTKIYEKIRSIRNTFMRNSFGPSTFGYHYQTMLWIEEIRAQEELSEFDIEETTLRKHGLFYIVDVPGLAEKRPSVLIGDQMFVRPARSEETPFEGYVHKIESTSVHLRFNNKFKFDAGRKYEVSFRLNRLVFRRMHQGLACTDYADRISFPDSRMALNEVKPSKVRALQPSNADIGKNEAQRRAVASIVNMPPGANPFIVYGPPGTGKTVTIVEAIKQILKSQPRAKVLACAPSNSAADIITERLAELGSTKLIRLVAPSRHKDAVNKRALPFTRRNSEDVFICPPKAELEHFRVVVSTCISASVPYGIGVDPGHFTHVFVDEAGQATEPEVMVPIRTSIGPNTNVIVSGDVKQLGPIVRSSLARELGLGKSYLERLMDTEAYDEVAGRNKSLVKLVQNYRSHSDILSFSNEQFYRRELQVCAGRDKTHRIVDGKWAGLAKRDVPLIFHSVRGKDGQEIHSPSYYNTDEIVLVKEYITDMLNDKKLGLKPKDIGIITPYRAQKMRIKSRIGSFAKETDVGSVEEFQGQERPVIIISTVRSSPDSISYDLRHTLGFVANPRRFNVAVTRAQCLLIVIGDPIVLALDPLWKKFINYVHCKGGFKGAPIDWDPLERVDESVNLVEARQSQGLSELEELIRRTSEMDLASEEESEWEVVREED